MADTRYYSPRLNRSLISPLYHAAKTQRVPMTTLASRLVAEGLSRMNKSGDQCVVAEEPPAPDSKRMEYKRRIAAFVAAQPVRVAGD